MEIETFNLVNEDMNITLKLVEVFMQIALLLTIAGLAIYLAGIAWFWFEGKRRSITETRTARRAAPLNSWRRAPRVSNKRAHSTFIHEEINVISKTVKSISLAVMTAFLMTSALAQGQQSQNVSPKDSRQKGAAAPAGNTPGRIARYEEHL